MKKIYLGLSLLVGMSLNAQVVTTDAMQNLPLFFNSTGATANTSYYNNGSRVQVDANNATIANFRATENNNSVEIRFHSLTDVGTDHHEIQRSNNGLDFIALGKISVDPTGTTPEYAYVDATPLSGYNYYRIKSYDRTGTVSFSSIRKIDLSAGRSHIIITPNPVRNRQLNLQLRNLDKGQYSIDLFNTAGVRVYSQSFTHMGGSLSEMINLPATVSMGMYRLQVMSGVQKFSHNVQVVQ